MESSAKCVVVVGGGAAGLAAAVAAARAGAHVTVLEAQDRVGNSIKITGDGRCNIANTETCATAYRNEGFVSQVFDVCSPADAIAFLESLGLVLREEGEGRLYPLTNKATSVIDALRLAVEKAGVEERCGAPVRSIRRVEPARPPTRWELELGDGEVVSCNGIVLACGGVFREKLLPRDIPMVERQPALGPLATETKPLRGLDKVRAKCEITGNGHVEVGEVTFRSYGISGIAAFNMTRHVAPGDTITMNFLPGWTKRDADGFLTQRLSSLQPETWLEYTCGLLLPLVARAVLRAAGLHPEGCPRVKDLPAFTEALLEFPLVVEGIGDRKLCQVHRGGVDVTAVDPATMQLHGFPGLHVAGEMLDVDGPCGGYNLHWAWISGVIAGRAAAIGAHASKKNGSVVSNDCVFAGADGVDSETERAEGISGCVSTAVRDARESTGRRKPKGTVA